MATHAADGPQAWSNLLATNISSCSGCCWHWVWNAYDKAGADSDLGSTSTAYQGWQQTPGKHYDMNPPYGAAVWLGERYDGNMDGDVFIAGQSDGNHAATDQPVYGTTGKTSIQARMDLCGREYLGWTDHVSGAPINMGGSGGKPTAKQRQVVSDSPANVRDQPSTSGKVTDTLTPGTIADFDGWINGESVDGNKVWFRGAHSGNWCWSGGFTDKGTHDLENLNDDQDLNDDQRQVVSTAAANGRSAPNTSATINQSLAAGTVADFSGWATGEKVEGNDLWYQGAYSGDWFWSGGFTTQSKTGLEEVDVDPDPEPPDPDNPRGLTEYTPVYPRATVGLEAPLGFDDCPNPVNRLLRDKGGSDQHPVDPLIDRFIIHWTGTTSDQADYFSWCNDRSSCPTLYLRQDGSTLEMIRPLAKPASTGPDWNYRSISVETLGADGLPVTDDQLEELAQIAAWIASYDGKELDGVPVSFTLDREHVINHQEAQPGTECPGPQIVAAMDSIVARAIEILGGDEPEPPTDGTLDPADYPTLAALQAELNRAFGTT